MVVRVVDEAEGAQELISGVGFPLLPRLGSRTSCVISSLVLKFDLRGCESLGS